MPLLFLSFSEGFGKKKAGHVSASQGVVSSFRCQRRPGIFNYGPISSRIPGPGVHGHGGGSASVGSVGATVEGSVGSAVLLGCELRAVF